MLRPARCFADIQPILLVGVLLRELLRKTVSDTVFDNLIIGWAVVAKLLTTRFFDLF